MIKKYSALESWTASNYMNLDLKETPKYGKLDANKTLGFIVKGALNILNY